MPAQYSDSNTTDLDLRIQKEKTSLLNDFPTVSSQVQQILKRLEFSASYQAEKPVQNNLKSSISKDEITSILNKLQEIIQLPSASFDQETLLYLEQQLTDILGFDISTTLDGVTLPFSKAIIKALPELKTTPHDRKIAYIPEAGQSRNRSYFGWENTNLNLPNTDQNSDSLFWIAAPLFDPVTEKTTDSNPKKWWRNRKLVLINAVESIAVVAVVKDTFLDTSNKYQLGASPAVIREGFFWSPLNLGKSLVFFIDDPANQVKLGKYPLYN